ncbi:MAG: glycosyltransferase family 2 protein [Myxococcales bacterium]|nr:glycosyltransferase family 2 protein [Myxococcales bacterium]
MTGFLNIAVLVYFVALTAGYIAQFVAAVFGVVRVRRDLEGSSPENVSLRGRATLPISIMVPAHNEELTVVESVRALLNLRYPEHEVVVVNDGSKDETLLRLRTAFALEPVPLDIRHDLSTKPIRAVYRSAINQRLLVIDKENGGKADALNCAVNAARFPLVCAVDADTLIIPDALLRLVRPFLSDLETVGVGGTLCLANGCKIEKGNVIEVGLPRRWLPRFQVVEYMRAFLVGRLGWDGLGGNLIISGAFGLFRRSAVIQAGGYATDSVGEDMELIARLRHNVPRWLQARAIRHLPDPVSFTEAPDSIRILGNQRDRWQRGLFDTLWRHRRMTLNPRYGAIGLFAMPFFWLFELVGPVIEFFGYLYFFITAVAGELEPLFASLFAIVAMLSGFGLSIGAILLEELSLSFFRAPGDMRRLVTVALLENFGYRQMLLFYRIRGMFKYLTGGHGWGRMTRKGFAVDYTRNQGGGGIFVPAIVITLVTIMLALPISWLVKPRDNTQVVVVDKTVPLASFREHHRLMWMLSQHKVPAPGNRLLWNRERDYIGYDPRSGDHTDLSDLHLKGKDLLYIADTYGVYKDDYEAARLNLEHLERSKRIYGGLTMPEVQAIERFAKAGGRVAAEFNSFASPTSGAVRRRMEKVLRLKWTGWVARKANELSDYREIADWIRKRWEKEFGKVWDLEGPGVIFVHEDGRVLVLRVGPELSGPDVVVVRGERKIPYHYWFDIVVPSDPKTVRATYQVPLTPAGGELMRAFGIPSQFPAVLHDDNFERAYFAGDFSDFGGIFDPPWLAGITTIRMWLSRVGLVTPEAQLTWEVYAPIVEQMLEADG